jgi:hypothetical protein
MRLGAAVAAAAKAALVETDQLTAVPADLVRHHL